MRKELVGFTQKLARCLIFIFFGWFFVARRAWWYRNWERKLVKQAVDGNIHPLLQALLNKEILWWGGGPNSYGATSRGGAIYVESDMYFYLYLLGNRADYYENITALEGNRLECAAINAAVIGRALSDADVVKNFGWLEQTSKDFETRIHFAEEKKP